MFEGVDYLDTGGSIIPDGIEIIDDEDELAIVMGEDSSNALQALHCVFATKDATTEEAPLRI